MICTSFVQLSKKKVTFIGGMELVLPQLRLYINIVLRPPLISIRHYIDVIMTTVASQITSLTVVYLIVYSDADQRKHESSASLAIVRGIHRDRWIPRTKGQWRGKWSHLMTSSCICNSVIIDGWRFPPDIWNKLFGFACRHFPYGNVFLVSMRLVWRRFKTQRPEQHGRHLAVFLSAFSWMISMHDDVIKWMHFPRYWSLVWDYRWIPSPRPVTRSFDIFFDLRLNKQLSKQPRRRWIEAPWRWLWCDWNGIWYSNLTRMCN